MKPTERGHRRSKGYGPNTFCWAWTEQVQDCHWLCCGQPVERYLTERGIFFRDAYISLGKIRFLVRHAIPNRGHINN